MMTLAILKQNRLYLAGYLGFPVMIMCIFAVV